MGKWLCKSCQARQQGQHRGGNHHGAYPKRQCGYASISPRTNAGPSSPRPKSAAAGMGSGTPLQSAMCWRHGLRVSELVALRWDHVEWKTAHLTVHRAKGSIDSTHPFSGGELRELRALQRTQEPGCRFIFMNERRAPMTAAGFRKMLSAVRAACGQPHVHPHMLRHSCGYMADHSQDVRVMQDWLGHANANVQITVRYTALAPGRLDKAKAPG